MLEDILAECGYTNGTWKLRFNAQLRQKSNMKFKVVRQESRAIRCRVKAGDNSTAWEIHLTPPQKLLTQDVVTNLQRVHGKKLTIPAPRNPQPNADEPLRIIDHGPIPEFLQGQIICGWSDEKTGKGCHRPAVESILTNKGESAVCEKHMMDPRWFKASSTVKNMSERLEEERAKEAQRKQDELERNKRQREEAKQKKREARQREEELAKKQAAAKALAEKKNNYGSEREWELAERKKIDENKAKPKPVVKDEEDPLFDEIDLRITPDEISEAGLKGNGAVLAKALVAIAMITDDSGTTYRHKATKSIKERLGIDDKFANEAGGYTVVGIVRELVNDLHDQGLIERTCRTGSRNNLYRLTDEAAKRLAGYRKLGILPEEVIDTEIVDEAEYEATVDKVADNFDEISNLVKLLETLQEESTTAQEEIEEIVKKRQTHEEAIAGIEVKLAPLREEIVELQLRIEEHEDSIKNLNIEEEQCKEIDKEAQKNIVTAREQLRSLV